MLWVPLARGTHSREPRLPGRLQRSALPQTPEPTALMPPPFTEAIGRASRPRRKRPWRSARPLPRQRHLPSASSPPSCYSPSPQRPPPSALSLSAAARPGAPSPPASARRSPLRSSSPSSADAPATPPTSGSCGPPTEPHRRVGHAVPHHRLGVGARYVPRQPLLPAADGHDAGRLVCDPWTAVD